EPLGHARGPHPARRLELAGEAVARPPAGGPGRVQDLDGGLATLLADAAVDDPHAPFARLPDQPVRAEPLWRPGVARAHRHRPRVTPPNLPSALAADRPRARRPPESIWPSSRCPRTCRKRGSARARPPPRTLPPPPSPLSSRVRAMPASCASRVQVPLPRDRRSPSTAPPPRPRPARCTGSYRRRP